MLCSVPPAGKSGSNWLDRLRSSRGFLTTSDDGNNDNDNNLGLDHFLRHQNPSESTRSNSGSTQSDNDRVANQTHENGHQPQQQLYNLVNNVLSELFFMDGANDNTRNSRLSGKKIPRKQTAPKSLTTSTASNNIHLRQVEEEKSPSCTPKDESTPATASFGTDNSLTEGKEANVEEEEEEEEEKDERELVGYSTSDVTVIDTSFGVWKSEKVVYRRKNVWKVREKRGKVRSFGRKKRKSGECDVDGGNEENSCGLMKKAKVSGSESGVGNQEQNPQNDIREEVCKDTPDDLPQVPKKRFPCSRSPRKSRKGGSSVILIKGMPTNKKQGGKLLKKCPKESGR